MKLDIGARIKELREARGLSTNKLSNMAGLSQSYVRKLEKGESRPTVESLELLCHALGITFEDFIPPFFIGTAIDIPSGISCIAIAIAREYPKFE